MVIIWLLLEMLGIVYGNVGFEYEVDIAAVDELDVWKNVVGLPVMQKPIGAGSNGWWEVQLDFNGHVYEIEVVFPPARTTLGMPDDGSYIQEELCPAFAEINNFFAQMQRELRHQFQAGKFVFDISMPGSFPPFKLPFMVAKHEIPDFPIAGTLQATVGVPLPDFMKFIGKTLEDPNAGVYAHRQYMKDIYDVVTSMTNISPSGQSLVYLLSTYYYLGNSVEAPITYLKSIASVMSRTNHAKIFLNLPDEDKQEFFRLSSAQEDSGESRGQGLFQAIKSVIDIVLPDQEFSDKFFTKGVRTGTQRSNMEVPILSVSESCEELGRGIDVFAECCQSMGRKSFLPTKEIVVEFRCIPVQASYQQAWSFAKDFFKFVVDFKADPENSIFEIGAGRDLCKPLPLPAPLEQSVWFSIKTPFHLDDSVKDYFTGSSNGYRVLSGCLRQLWEFGVWDQQVFVQIPNKLTFPRGFAKDEQTEKDVMFSLVLLETQLMTLAQDFEAQTRKYNSGPITVQSGLIGRIPPERPILLTTDSPRFVLDIGATLLLTLDNAFATISNILTVPSWEIPYRYHISQVISNIDDLFISNIGKLFVLSLCLNKNFIPIHVEIQYDPKSLYQLLKHEDENLFDFDYLGDPGTQDRSIALALEKVVKRVFPSLRGNQNVFRTIRSTLFSQDSDIPSWRNAMKSAGRDRVYVFIQGPCPISSKAVEIIKRVRSLINEMHPLLATGADLLS